MAASTSGAFSTGSIVKWRSLEWRIEETSKTHLELVPYDPIQEKAIGRIRIARALSDQKQFEPVDSHDTLIFPEDDDKASWEPTSVRLSTLPFLRFPSWARSDKLLWSTAIKVQEIDRQLVPLHFALEQKNPRIMIADDVGLGKTTEAAIIANEFLARSLAKRILIICPAQLIEKKWIPELNQRFGLSFSAIDGENLANVYSAMQLNATENPFSQLDRVVVSLDWAKQPFIRSRLKESPWDLVIIDECHRVANRSSSNSSATLTARFARELALATKGLILMSATPHDGDPQSFQSLIDLLKTKSALVENPPKPLVVRRLRRDLSESSRRMAPEPKFIQFHPPSSWATVASEIDSLIEAISRTEKNSPRELLRIVLLKRFMSSTQALADTLNVSVNSDSGEEDSNEGLVASFMESDAGTKHKNKILAALKDLESNDPKFEALANYLKDDVPSNDNLIIFTEFESTARYLEQKLSSIRNLKRKVLVATGKDRNELEVSLTKFKNGTKSILIATDALSEGVDLQHSCHRLLHYDLPFRPYRLEQRNGRVDRMGQTQKPLIHLLCPFEDKLKKWTKDSGTKSAQSVMADTLSVFRLYRFLIQQAGALNNSIVPVLEALSLSDTTERELLEKIDHTLDNASSLAPDDYEISISSRYKGRDYDFRDDASIKSLTWSAQKEVDLEQDLLSKVAPRVFETLKSYWEASGLRNLSFESENEIVGARDADIWARLRPENRAPKEENRLILKSKEDCVFQRETEVLSWAHGIWDEIEQALFWHKRSRGSVNVSLSNIKVDRAQVLFLVRSGAGLKLRLFEKQGSWKAQEESNAIAVLRDELLQLAKSSIVKSQPKSIHREWVKSRFETIRADLKNFEQVLGVIVRDEN